MTEATKTSGAQHIEQLMQQLAPDSERYRVLASARQFKSSWVELGEWLARVSNSNQFSDWGYTTFEDYCTKEVRIRRKTAEKLLLAYRFLERKEPGLLERKAGHPLPDYRSVDLLRQAEEERPFSMAEYAELRESVIEQEHSHPTVARQFRDMDHRHQPEQKTSHQYRNALMAANRLPDKTEEQAAEKAKAVDEANKTATLIPFSVCEDSLATFDLIDVV
ncbi:MAG: cyclodeaminase/cyclohydrolase family protein, partial [Deltaproteobacteria bacterium]|nr:cyclodeaminase/cyclohydrolase family protein [Deltaproteobacteria bacterium]